MKKQGYIHVYLWVLKNNKRARNFYEKNNFDFTDDIYAFEILEKPLVDVRYIMRLNR